MGEGGQEQRSSFDLRKWLPYMGLVVAFIGTLPYYSGPGGAEFDSAAEFANHVVPSMAVAVSAIWVLLVRGRAKGPGAVPFFAGMVSLLAGLFMVATHAPLVAQAFNGESPWPASIYHSSTALITFGLGLLWCVTHWPDLAELEEAEKSAKGGARSS